LFLRDFEGRNIIRFEDGTIPQWFYEIRPLLSKLRENRTLPFVDRKIQTSWSAMMIATLFEMGAVAGGYMEKAHTSLQALLDTLYIDGKLYHTTLIHKTPKVEAFLEDYAFLAQALLVGYKYTQEEIYLIQAQHFANKALEEFYDKGKWYFSNTELRVAAEVSDNTYTSSVSIMVDVLITLGVVLEDEKYTHFAFKTMEYNSYELGRRPIYYPYMLTQAVRYVKGDRIIKASLQDIHNNTLELAKIRYPFTQLKMGHEDGYMVCGKQSCFANTQDATQLNTLIENSF